MKKLKLMKTLLVAVGLLLGTSAWAQSYTEESASCDFEKSETLFTASGRMTGSNAADPTNASNHVYSFTSASNAANAAPGAFAYYDFSSIAKTAAIVDISFDCYIPQTQGQVKVSFGDASIRTSSIFTNKGAWSYNSSGAIFAIGSERGKLNGSTNEDYASVSGTNYGSTTTLKAESLLGLWVSVSATVNISEKKVSYTIRNKSTNAELISVTDAAFYSDAANACTQIDIQTGVNSQTAYVDNVSITAYIDESEKYADYTIKYMYGLTEIKTARIVESVLVGSDATITNSDKANIWYNDEKYIYESDNTEGKTVAEDGSTVVTVTFRKATTAAYSVNLIDAANENVLIEDFATGSIIEGEPVTVYYHKAIKIGGVWYVRAQNGEEPYYGINVVAGVNTVAYTANNDISYFFEVEDLPVVQLGSFDGWRNDGLANRSSGGVAPRHYAKNYAYTEALTGGIYTLNMNARNQSSSVSDNTILAVMDANGNITDLDTQFTDWAKAQTAEKSISVSIPDGAKFVLRCGNNNSNLNMDFLLFTRTADYTIPATITSSTGYATFSSTHALDFSEVTGLTAYKATACDGTNVTLTPVFGTVAANTGLVIKGETTDIPVVATGDAQDGNMLFALDGSYTELGAGTGGTNYVLSVQNDKAVFAPISATPAPVTAGHAALFVPNGSARTLNIVFDEDATGINAVSTTKAETGDYYNLAGQRVAQPTKGLYIVNGKKVVIK